VVVLVAVVRIIIQGQEQAEQVVLELQVKAIMAAHLQLMAIMVLAVAVEQAQ
jgi:hypothetical protein